MRDDAPEVILLREILSTGPVHTTEAKARFCAGGFSQHKFYKVAKKIGAKPSGNKRLNQFWSLPAESQRPTTPKLIDLSARDLDDYKAIMVKILKGKVLPASKVRSLCHKRGIPERAGIIYRVRKEVGIKSHSKGGEIFWQLWSDWLKELEKNRAKPLFSVTNDDYKIAGGFQEWRE